MPISMRLEPESGVVIMTGSGVLHVADAIEAARASWSAPARTDGTTVWDFRAAQFDLSSSEIREIAEFMSMSDKNHYVK